MEYLHQRCLLLFVFMNLLTWLFCILLYVAGNIVFSCCIDGFDEFLSMNWSDIAAEYVDILLLQLVVYDDLWVININLSRLDLRDSEGN